MRYTYIRPFMDAAHSILEHILGGNVSRGEIRLSPTSVVSRGVATIVGLTGDARGRVLFDMAPDTALNIAAAMNGEPFTELGNLGRDSISELASMIAGRAISILNDEGNHFVTSPPTLLTSENLTISNSDLETLVVPLDTAMGSVVVNVAITTG